ncbi:DUF4270 family protein [Flavihumibacter petaseus]|nr:DUF4270 family protein [Flavihumibacter petaseus]
MMRFSRGTANDPGSSKVVVVVMTAVIVTAMAACSKTSQYIDTIAPSDNPYLIQVDTFGGAFTTLRVDSFVTSSQPYAAAGYLKDAVTGSVFAAHYFRYTLPVWEDIPNTAVFDSLELILKLTHSWSGDSTQPYRLRVDRLSQAITNDKNLFYNSSSLATAEMLGSFSEVIRPVATDTLHIRLSQSWGNELYELLRERGATVISLDKFQDYFKGLKLSGDSSASNMVLQFKDSITMRLHYHERNVVNISRTIDFQKDYSPHRFNQIKQNFAGTAIDVMNKQLEVRSNDTRNQFFLFEANRVRATLKFPDIKQLLQAASFVKVMGAELELRPALNSFTSYPLPPKVVLYEQKEDGTLNGPLSTTAGVQYGSLFIDNVYGKDTRYTYDITSYITSALTADDYSASKLVIAGEGGDSTLHRLVAGDLLAAENRSRLVLSLLVYHK